MVVADMSQEAASVIATADQIVQSSHFSVRDFSMGESRAFRCNFEYASQCLHKVAYTYTSHLGVPPHTHSDVRIETRPEITKEPNRCDRRVVLSDHTSRLVIKNCSVLLGYCTTLVSLNLWGFSQKRHKTPSPGLT